MTDVVRVDGHVHLYDCYDRRAFFGAAWQRLCRSGPAAGIGCLLFAETSREHAFERLREDGLPAPWKIEPTAEEESLRVTCPDRGTNSELLVMAGRQVATRERLEVLALVCGASFEDGEPAESVVEAVRSAGGVPVLPWGVGKWTGSRGHVVRDLRQSHDLLLGDNSGRPALCGSPQLFGGGIVLPGTDSLAFAGAASLVGSYGFELPGPVDRHHPARWMRERFDGLSESPAPFGRRASFARFVREQLGLRLRRARA